MVLITMLKKAFSKLCPMTQRKSYFWETVLQTIVIGMNSLENKILRGIGGDVINGVIDRLDEVTESKPSKIFLMIGINDLSRRRKVEQILSDYKKLIELIIEKSLETNLFIQSILPTDNRANLQNTDIVLINSGLESLAQKYNLTFINLFDLLKTDFNVLNKSLSNDGLHLNGQGYLIWKKAIQQYIPSSEGEPFIRVK
jgi:lysophospholipase L1-like esterase